MMNEEIMNDVYIFIFQIAFQKTIINKLYYTHLNLIKVSLN